MPSLESRLGLAVVRSRSSVVNQRPYAPSAPVFWTPGVTGGASSSDVPPGARFAGAAAALAVQSRRRAARRLCVRRSKAADEENAFDMDDIDKDMDFGEESNWDDEALPLAEDEVEDWDQEGTTMRFAEEDEDMYDKDWDEEAGAMRFEDDMDGDMYNDEEDWDEGYSMPFEEEDPGPGRSEGAFVGSVFDGMDEPASSSRAIPSYEELSLLYDDFPVQGQAVQPAAPPKVAVEEATKSTSRSGRTLEYMEEREYQVTAEGIAIRTLPDERSPRTGEILRQGETFTAIEAVDGLDSDQRLYLRLPEGRGWVFNDEKIYPGMPSVKLISEIAQNRSKPEVIKRPLVAVVGRPNVGKSTLVNRICDIPDVIGGITHDEVNVTHDRTYKPAEHTDDCGDTYLFDVIDAGGLVFEDSLETVTFAKEIKFQIDVALREACAAVMVVDGNVGVTDDDMKVAKYLKDTYISRGLRVVLAVAKCDRLETMDIKAADFWQLGLGEPIPLSAYHRRGTWELMDALINKGCNGLFPQKSKDQWQRSEPRDNAIKVAICGKPNAGKSSLFNALVGEAFPTQSSSSQGRAFLEFTWDGMGRDLVPPAAVLAYMKTAAEYGDSSRTSRRYFPKTWTYPDVGDFQAESAMPDAARTKFSYHLTLGQNGDPVSQVNANIGKTKEEWNKLITTEMLPYFHKVQSEQVEFYYASTDIDSIEINSTLFNDLLMAIGSIAFVILYLRIHTGGWVVSISSFLIIFISVPLAYIMTPAAKATIASFLSVFLITGIGCDVVFVFTDFWEQGHKLPMESRVMWMIVHGGESCLATSMTTALSFFANLASALQPLREFGMFMGLCVMCAFFLVLLMIPPLLVAIERRKEMVKLRVVDISSGQGVAAYEEKKKKKKDGVMNALLFHLMNGIARCPCMVVLTTFVFFITAAVGVVVTAKLSTGVPDIFPPSHNQVANKAVLDLFSTEANLQYPAPSSGLICNADTVNGTDTGNCQLHWCEAVSDGLGSTTTTSTGLTSQMSCWRSPTLKLDGSTKISIGYSTEGCWDVNIYARVAMEQVSNAAFNRTLVLALEDELGPAGYTHLPPSVSSLRPLIVEKWEDGSVEAVKFWQARTFTATAPFRGQVDVRNTTEDLCELHVLCFKEEGYQCGISGWKRLGSAAYPLARRLSPVFAPFSRQLQGELVTQTVPTPVDVTVIWGIRSARSTPLVGPPSEFWSYDPNFVPQNPWAQRAIRNMCSGLTKNLKVFRAKCWISLFETYLNQQNKRFPSRTFDGDVIGWYYSNTVEAQAHLWFQDRKVIACKLQFLVNVGIYVPSSQGLLYMKEWDSFVEGKNAVASMTANRAWHTASIWVRSEAEVAIIGSTIDTIIIATCSGWAGVFLFTGDLWLAVIVTCVVIVVITGLAFYISCIMAWSIGPIEVISLVVFVGYSVTYALHIAHNYNQMRDSDKDLLEAEAKVRKRKMARAKAQAARKRAAAAAAGADEDLEDLQAAVQLDLPEQELRLEDITFTPAQLREARTRVAVLHVGGATLSSALSTAGSSAFLLLCTLTIFVKLGGVVVAVTVLSILGAIVTLPAALMLVGPAPDAWYKQKVRRLLQMLMGGKAQDQEPLLDSDLGSPSPKDPSELY